jgi:ankyrin repeat protein
MDDGANALHIAARCGHELVLRKLIKNGADVNWFVVEFIIRFKTDKNIFSRGPRGRTPLHFAVQQGYLNPVRCLCENGANVHAIDDDECSALHLAAFSTNPSADVVRYLLSLGVESSRRDQWKRFVILSNGAFNRIRI